MPINSQFRIRLIQGLEKREIMCVVNAKTAPPSPPLYMRNLIAKLPATSSSHTPKNFRTGPREVNFLGKGRWNEVTWTVLRN